MSANPMRRVAIATAAAILIGSSVAAATSAAPPPEANTWYACQTISAGYSPGAGGNASAWVWDGRLQWELCVAQTSTGRHYAIARLSSPADLIGPFNKFSQLVHVQLWKCTSSGLVKVAQADWSVANTETATKIGNRYYFRWIQTPSTTSTATTYRVRTEAWGATVMQSSGWVFSLSQDGLHPYPGYRPGVSVSGCVNP